MAVRNFYLEAQIDGRKTDLSGGPRSKDGEMSVYFTQRKDGNIISAFRVECIARRDGSLVTRIFDNVGNPIGELVTNR